MEYGLSELKLFAAPSWVAVDTPYILDVETSCTSEGMCYEVLYVMLGPGVVAVARCISLLDDDALREQARVTLLDLARARR